MSNSEGYQPVRNMTEFVTEETLDVANNFADAITGHVERVLDGREDVPLFLPSIAKNSFRLMLLILPDIVRKTLQSDARLAPGEKEQNLQALVVHLVTVSQKVIVQKTAASFSKEDLAVVHAAHQRIEKTAQLADKVINATMQRMWGICAQQLIKQGVYRRDINKIRQCVKEFFSSYELYLRKRMWDTLSQGSEPDSAK